MPVRYDPLLTLALARAIERRWFGATVTRLAMAPERHAATLRFSDRSVLATLFNRGSGVVAALDTDPLDDDRARVTRFGRLSLTSVEAPPDERTISLTLSEPDGTPSTVVVLELQTNRWNVLLLAPGRGATDVEWRVRYALWTREARGRRIGPGEPYAPPVSDRAAIEVPPSPTEWEEWLGKREGGADTPVTREEALTRWAWTSPLNFERVFGERAGSYERYVELHAARDRLAGEDIRVGLRAGSRGHQPYPVLGGEAAAHGDALEAMAAALDGDGGLARALGEGPEDEEPVAASAEVLERRLRKRADRETKRVAALERQLASAGGPEAPRELGQILLARKNSVERGAASVVLQAFDGTAREIALDPTLDVVGNAERFFEEARRRERALEKLPAEIASARTRMQGFLDALERLAAEGPTDELWRFAGERPPGRGKKRKREEERLPYVRLVSSGGLDIRVGRGSRDNDDLTFRHSAPDDIWLHASQASGAHVILRWGRREENPPMRDLLEAAAAAAVNSQARHSGSVAVVWTRRKHVRKPRKSPPGTVIPDRAQTVMVEPDADLVRKLRPND